MRVLVLLTDAFGARGGIALYNRDFLTALTEMPEISEVIAVPRVVTDILGEMPGKLRYIDSAASGKFTYIKTIMACLVKYKGIRLVVCGHINLLPLAYIVSKIIGVPVLLEIYGIDAWKPSQNKITNRLIRKVDYCISISDITRKRFASWAGLDEKKILLLPNAIHADLYGLFEKNGELVNKYNLTNKKVIMTLGRMSSQERYKGFDEIIDLLPRLLSKEPSLVYLAVGDGDDRKRLIDKVSKLGLQKNVIFPGYINEEEKPDYFRLADVFVMPSYGEGFGFVFLEALACGTPVIASKTDGGREAVLDGELGTIVDPYNPQSIIDAIFKNLGQKKEIPSRLTYFSYVNFQKRVRNIIVELCNS